MLTCVVSVLVLAAGVAVTPTAAESKQDPAAQELKALEGTWEVVTHEVNGKGASDAGYASPKKIVISAGGMDLYESGQAEYPIKIDPAKTPKAIDVYTPKAMKLNAHIQGIYALNKDELKICLPLSGEVERPAKFSSENYHALYVLRRVK
jgi:uncharacterized protein (TIGR03067 family)